ncbi:MAG: gamma-glutamyl-gamma-aminobutyrate hydrolase family protein [Planctomycetes bacterium]|nr:gamma-glutamyl-gamma-aminobutyrate hydrolase family protein [Planctomycetota bacterium]
MTRPLIGIVTDFDTSGRKKPYAVLYHSYIDAIVRAGGTPMLIPPVPVDCFDDILERVDGVLFTGGDDLDPRHYGEAPQADNLVILHSRREEFELKFTPFVIEKEKPFMSICCGMQIANVVQGGTLYQDIRSEIDSGLIHTDGVIHAVEVKPGTDFAKFVGASRLDSHSQHHQAVKKVGARLRVTAQADDGIIEAIELEDYPLSILVQWHPENQPTDKVSNRMFEKFVASSRRYQRV